MLIQPAPQTGWRGDRGSRPRGGLLLLKAAPKDGDGRNGWRCSGRPQIVRFNGKCGREAGIRT